MIALPGATAQVMTNASAEDLRLLILLCAEPALRENTARLCERLGCTEEQVRLSLAFWRGAGVLTAENGVSETPASQSAAEESVPTAVSAPAAAHHTDSLPRYTTEELSDLLERRQEAAPAAHHTDSLPRYTTEELSDLLERRQEAAALIDECQRVLGRIFNVREIGVLVGLLDYLSLDAEYLILLCAHCAGLGKTSIHYVEKVAQDMVAGGACTVEALQETLRREDAAREAEGRIRALFGAQDRKLTATERKYIRRWTDEWKFDMGMIELAYEATVDTIGDASMRYTDGVLKRWAAEGLTTPEAVAASDERWRRARENEAASAGKSKTPKDGGKKQGGSFDVDDFFEAALKRSYEDI